MGVGWKCSPGNCWTEEESRKMSNTLAKMPRPDYYKILSVLQIGQCLLVELKYPNCTNYEGKKILLFKEMTLKELIDHKEIDPHFFENSKFSPCARFEPTVYGWKMGQVMAQCIVSKVKGLRGR